MVKLNKKSQLTPEQNGLIENIKIALSSLLGSNATHVSIDQYQSYDGDGTNVCVSASSTFLMKSLSEERQEVTGVVLEPEVTDLQGDIYSEDEIHGAMKSFNLECRKANLQHEQDLGGAAIVESWQTKADQEIFGKMIKKGTWLLTMYLPEREWKEVKKGTYTGFSIGCKASTEGVVS